MNGKAEDWFIENIYICEIPDFQNPQLSTAQVTEHTLNLIGEEQVTHVRSQVKEIKFGHRNLPFPTMKIALLF